MRSLWNDADAAAYGDDPLGLRVYTSRLLGADPALVLHGGGNTSVKLHAPNVFGEDEHLLYIKGSGWDLATIEARGFAPVRMDHLGRLAELEQLSDLAMATELRVATVDPAAPAPSVESILHTILPFRYVDHTHADALIAIMNTPHGEEHIRELYGDRVVVIPYVMPGFELARVCAELYAQQAGPHTVGMVLMNHGLFTWGESARAAYEQHIALVDEAEAYLAAHAAWELPALDLQAAGAQRVARAELRLAVSSAAGAPMILSSHTDPQALGFARRADLTRISQQGPATPDHVIRTKRQPMIGRDVEQYASEYQAYFEQHAAGQALRMLDPAPRVILDHELGMITVGRTARDAAIAEDVYRHTIDIILRAEALGGYHALPAGDLFAVEYWDLEQAKLKRSGKPAPFAGNVALVTGAASGIGRACVEALLARGAAVTALDVDPAVDERFARPDVLPVVGDVSRPDTIERALGATAMRFGGCDMLIVNAGVFGASRPIAALDDAEWERVMRINLDANLALLRAAHPLLARAPGGGRVV
ncbi:MAG TPA: SDR family NAD(P)-dependent oxidoreductase, partial [Roseiflexaceae bacterium]|nr:SDR family NAD(P)-dependent oxidoreductase [Roseiflexaceae bacterium]